MDTEHGEAPYTHQPGHCGEEGEPVLISDEYLLNLMENPDEMVLKYGPIGKMLVHWKEVFQTVYLRESSYTRIYQVPLWLL